MARQHVSWGTVTFTLDNETFRHAYTSGRRMSFDDCEYDFPQVAQCMTTLDVVGSVLDEDGKGGYRFDRMAFHGPLDIPGFFLDYMSGPLTGEAMRSARTRLRRVVVLPEAANPLSNVV